MLIFLIAGAVGGATSAFYLAYNYHPLLVNGVINGGIFVSPLVAMYFVKKLNVRTIGLYLAGALPVHLAIHFTIIGDLAQLIGVSHILLNFLSLP
jgi:ABC-type thiamin/hydroxymethylpyrimidine transport system permease subunit